MMKNSFESLSLFIDIIRKKSFIFFYLIVNYVNHLKMIQKIQNKEVVLVHVRIKRYFYLESQFFLLFIADIPLKRVDRQRSSGTNVGQSSNSSTQRQTLVAQLTEGSPLVPRRQLYSNIRYKSLNRTDSVEVQSPGCVTKPGSTQFRR
jgi:hypothetical protein